MIHRRQVFRSLCIALLGLFVLSIDGAPAQEMMRRDGGMRGDGMRGGDRGGGMRGVGTGIGIGIGTGLAIDAIRRSREAETPVNDGPRRSSVKKTKQPKQTAKKRPPRSEPVEPQTATTPPSQLRFVGKPDDVTHNPLQKDGKLGDLNDHKQTVVMKRDSHFRRHYYFTREGDQRTWFFYDVRIARDDPIIKLYKDVRSCGDNDDNCDGPPVINIDDKPAPGQLIEDKDDCPGAVRRVTMVTTACVDKKLHFIEERYNYCPPDKNNYHHTHKDIPTDIICGEGTARPAEPWKPELEDLRGKACGVTTDTGRTIEHPEEAGEFWLITRYHVYTCAGIPGKEFVGEPEKYTDGKVTEGGPKPRLDPAKLAPPGPI